MFPPHVANRGWMWNIVVLSNITACPQGLTSSIKELPGKGSTVFPDAPPAGDQVFRNMCLWGAFHIQTRTEKKAKSFFLCVSPALLFHLHSCSLCLGLITFCLLPMHPSLLSPGSASSSLPAMQWPDLPSKTLFQHSQSKGLVCGSCSTNNNRKLKFLVFFTFSQGRMVLQRLYSVFCFILF